MTGYRPHEGHSVRTPNGLGIVLQTVGLPTGNGVNVFLTENPTPEGSAASIYNIDQVEQGPALKPFEVGDTVTVPGGYPGQVIGRDGDIAVCRYETPRPRASRHGRFHDWQLHVSNLRGR